ncbi:MAG: hypothetical protein N3F67_03210 [Acidilobaceae archaeon]|nr:hypothetical protein [Acidilobaceae archaeon]
MKREVLLAGVLVLTTIAVALLGQATVYSYRSMTGSAIVAAQSPMRFEPGSNAGRPDVGGYPIGVTINAEGDRATVTIRPTYQTNWYRDVLRISNFDSAARQTCIYVQSPAALRPGDRAELFVFPSGAARAVRGYPSPTFTSGFLARLNLLAPDSACLNLASGAVVELDFIVYMADDGRARGATAATLRVESKR